MRNMVNRAFTPRMVADMEPRIREITRELLGAVVDRGEMDLVRDLAIPLPVTVIAEILGVDPALRDDFKRWSNAIVNGDMGAAPGDREAIGREIEEFQSFFERVIDERRREPKDDLISAVVRVDPDDADPLTPDEVLAFTGLLLIAGNETTTNLIGNAMLALFEHEDQLASVCRDASRISNMVEEALRYDSPVQFLFRTATEDVEVAGAVIPKDGTVIPIYASGNRDDRRFPDGDRFDISRNTQGHLAFGLGVHFCLGAPLARLEARVAFEELFARMGSLHRTTNSVERINSMFLRGLATLPVAFEPAGAAMPA
jgi:cytochrome P450